MDKDIRWQQRFTNLDKAFSRLHEVLHALSKEPENSLYHIALIGAFQFTFELCWKTMKDYLVYQGIEVSLPREVIKQAFQHKIIKNGQLWIDMLEDRNMMAHVYQEQAALTAKKNIQHLYYPAIEELYKFFLEKREY